MNGLLTLVIVIFYTRLLTFYQIDVNEFFTQFIIGDDERLQCMRFDVERCTTCPECGLVDSFISSQNDSFIPITLQRFTREVYLNDMILKHFENFKEHEGQFLLECDSESCQKRKTKKKIQIFVPLMPKCLIIFVFRGEEYNRSYTLVKYHKECMTLNISRSQSEPYSVSYKLRGLIRHHCEEIKVITETSSQKGRGKGQ